MTAEDFGMDLEHVEVLQRKFEEFLKELGNQQYRITEVNHAADKLVDEGHPESETIFMKKEVIECLYAFICVHFNDYIGSERCLASIEHTGGDTTRRSIRCT